MLTRSLSHRAPLLLLVLPFATGIALQCAWGVPRSPTLLVASAGLAAAAIGACFFRAVSAALGLASASLLCAGVINAQIALHRPPGWENLPPRESRLQVAIVRTFHGTDPSRVSAVARIAIAPEMLREIEGHLVFVTFSLKPGSERPIPSTRLIVTGVLSALPAAAAPGSFDSYLADSGVNFRLARARVVSITRPPDRFHRFCDGGARRLAGILGLGISDRQPGLTAVYRAMLLGWQGELTLEQRDVYLLSGTMHLFSVSGLHVVIIGLALHALLSALRVPRAGSAVTTVVVVGLHVVLTGASPAAVRAFLLVAFQAAAFLLRQPHNSVAGLGLAALVVLVREPLALLGASFQMSYGCVLAILVYGLPLGERFASRLGPDPMVPLGHPGWLRRFARARVRDLGTAAGIGIAATLVGTISGITWFHVVAPVSLLVNMAVIPIANLGIIGGGASIACGLAGFEAASSHFNHAAALVLWVVEAIARLSVEIPGGWWGAEWRTARIGNTALAAMVLLLLAGYATGWRSRLGGFWPPVILLVAAVLLGSRSA